MKRNGIITVITNAVIVSVIAALAVTATVASGAEAAFAPIRQGTDPHTVALTCNVYLGDEYVWQMAEILRRYGATATFFLGGSWVKKHPETCQMLVQYGLCIGSHGYSHLDHSTLDYGQNVAELNKAKSAIRTACGVDVDLFAPPAGAYNDNTLAACRDLGYTVVMWSKDTIDWRDQEVDIIIDRATRRMEAGTIILTHPTAATVAALPAILEAYLAAGYRFVTVRELAA